MPQVNRPPRAIAPDSDIADQSCASRDAVWTGIARGYAGFSSPMVPDDEDIRLYEQVAARRAAVVAPNRMRALLLGVTPGIVMMKWPPRAYLLAVEKSLAVIRALWPGDIPNARSVRCASWFDLPMIPGSCDLVLGDGVLNVCRFPGEVRDLGCRLRRLLAPEGVLAIRYYTSREDVEELQSVFDALFSPKGLKVDVFKMRLYQAMQRSAEEGVAVNEAAGILEEFGANPHVMRSRLGWSDAVIEPFSSWRTSGAVYSFASTESLAVALREYFDLVAVTYPGYEMGQFCPMLEFRAKG